MWRLMSFAKQLIRQPDYADAHHNLGVALAKTGDLARCHFTAWSES